MSKLEELKKIDDLRNRGILSEEEYQEEKRKLLEGTESSVNLFGMKGDSSYITLMHLSQFAGFIFPGLGFVFPVVLWLLHKHNPNINRHGINITNFLISWTIYYILFALILWWGLNSEYSFLIKVGVFLLIAFWLLQTILIVVATVKASKGKYWKYPLAINFIVLEIQRIRRYDRNYSGD